MLKSNYKKVNLFLMKYERELENPIIKSFLEKKENFKMLEQSICHPQLKNRENLDKAFQEFYAEVRLTHYLSMLLKFYAQKYYVKTTKHFNHYQLIMDKPQESGISFAELVSSDEEIIDIFLKTSNNLIDFIKDQKLCQIINSLTTKQQQILNLSFVYQFSHTEIGALLGVSQQYVSKTYQKILNKIRTLYGEAI
ncbi:hypothetical protein A2U94_19695 [Bacillus sp. VT 712]|uniref:RNA polymerase sigma-70 region 4 domain-containing protein n=1 Tax=Priestia veravalensis TaxID=1414648 RepID=A0A0V8J9X7_9BACI|nr:MULTISPECIES: sigma-70 family RNA polymerase sigma factor [Bacillaceae]KSU83986.1 hypothetical protein AS180_21070 [Priestia veravalensis]KZB89781.1 hypothetical protein A2U94_19695 [Bacillus sp. VT 712]SCC59706.1 RNA polymerase sigma factor, sigma-70 family [Priestia flexa]